MHGKRLPKMQKKSQTPQPPKGAKSTPIRGTPKSAPPLKRTKKMVEEEDDDISDEDFEMLIGNKMGKAGKGKTPEKPVAKAGSESDEDDDEDMSDLDDDDDSGDEEDMIEFEGEEGGSDEDDDEEDDDEEDEAPKVPAQQTPKGQAKKKQEQASAKKTPKSTDKKQKQGTTPQTKQTPKTAEKKQKQDAGKQESVKRKADGQQAQGNKESLKANQTELAEEAARIRDRDSRTLFLKNLPDDVTEQQIKGLSSDIQDVKIRMSYKRKAKSRGFAFLVFKNEKVAEKNYKLLQGKKIGERELVVDFVGEKSKNKPNTERKPEPSELDPFKLYLTGFGKDIVEDNLKQIFSTAKEVTLPVRKRDGLPLGYAFVEFETKEAAKEAHDKMQNKKIKGNTLVVLYAKLRSPKEEHLQKKKEKKQEKRQKQKEKKIEAAIAAKKQKMEEEEDDEDDDDEDDEDEEESGDEEVDDDEDDDDDDDEEDSEDDD